MIGLGAMGNADDARDFAARHGITFRMLWDGGEHAWDGYGVWGTPTAILVSRAGTTLKRWAGAMDDDQRAEAIRRAHDEG